MTRKKMRDQENRNFTGFRDMANFFTGNQDPTPPPGWPPLKRWVHTISRVQNNNDNLIYLVLQKNLEIVEHYKSSSKAQLENKYCLWSYHFRKVWRKCITFSSFPIFHKAPIWKFLYQIKFLHRVFWSVSFNNPLNTIYLMNLLSLFWNNMECAISSEIVFFELNKSSGAHGD